MPLDLDFGDYTALGFQSAFVNPFLLIDDYGGVYAGLGIGLGIPGMSVTRNDVATNSTDVDQLDLSDEQKAEVMRQALTGTSRSISGGAFFLEASLAWSVGSESQYYTGGGGTNFSPIPSAWVNFLSLSIEIR